MYTVGQNFKIDIRYFTSLTQTQMLTSELLLRFNGCLKLSFSIIVIAFLYLLKILKLEVRQTEHEVYPCIWECISHHKPEKNYAI